MIDFYDDSDGSVLRDIMRGIGPENVPDFVKVAGLVPSTEFRADKYLFADIVEKKFACDTPEDTWMSCMYFLKQAASMSFEQAGRIERTLLEACEMHGLPLSMFPAKAAATEFEQPVYIVPGGPMDCADLTHLPIHSKEATDLSAKTFSPHNLPEGEELNAAKYANTLISKCEEYDLPIPGSLAYFAQPVKRSHVVNTIRQRIGHVMANNEQFDKQESLFKSAAERGVDLPYNRLPIDRYDGRLLQAYDELQKLAYTADLDETFWGTFYTLDKLAGFTDHPGMIPVLTMANRPVQEDMFETAIKLAGVQVLVQDLMAVNPRVLADLAPEALAHQDNPVKFAAAVRGLSHPYQQALVVHLRGG